MTGNVIQELFQRDFPLFSQQHALPLNQHKAGDCIRRCRTGFYGSHVESCELGCTANFRHHSCHHRSCSQCNAVARENWLRERQSRLLDCAHYHVVFTLPQVFRRFWQYHQREVTADLFYAAKESLLRLCRDRVYMGARPGIIASFHSWTRNLSIHPHIHCLVSGMGLNEEGEWKEAKRACLLPSRLLMETFRVLLLKRWIKRAKQGGWSSPLGSRGEIEFALKSQYQHAWHVRVQPQYRHGRGVAIYIARYMRGGPIKSNQLEWLSDGRILLRLKPGSDGRSGVRYFRRDELMKSYLQHVPAHRQRLVRSYGLYADQHCWRSRLRVENKEERVIKLTAEDYWHRLGQGITVCAHCHTEVIHRGMSTVLLSGVGSRAPP